MTNIKFAGDATEVEKEVPLRDVSFATALAGFQQTELMPEQLEAIQKHCIELMQQEVERRMFPKTEPMSLFYKIVESDPFQSVPSAMQDFSENGNQYAMIYMDSKDDTWQAARWRVFRSKIAELKSRGVLRTVINPVIRKGIVILIDNPSTSAGSRFHWTLAFNNHDDHIAFWERV